MYRELLSVDLGLVPFLVLLTIFMIVLKYEDR
jgi:hypothetical protein